MLTNFPIKGLDFSEIKKNFITFLKNDSQFSDYNYEASGISSLINILAYNAHYIGFYVKALLGESFLDSATQRNTLFSRAKWNGYVPKNKRAARSEITLEIKTTVDNEPLSKSISIPKNSMFSGANSQSDSRSFYLLDDVVCYSRRVEGDNVFYTSPTFTVYEGTSRTWRFIKDTSIKNQRFLLQDTTIDIDTIRVEVYTDEENCRPFILATNLAEINASSEVFYLSSTIENAYEIFFGDNIFGKNVNNGDIISVTYISTNGSTGNGCKQMVFQRSYDDTEQISQYTHFTTRVESVSSGGLSEETIDELKFNIPYHYRRQNRAVVEGDYRAILLSEFRDIDSISVWGGEKNFTKDFNSVYISIKPKIGLTFNASTKKEIENLLKKYSVVNKSVKLVDPEYLKVSIDFYAKFNQRSTSSSSGTIEKQVLALAKTYNDTMLDRFENGLSDVDLLNYIKSRIPSLTRIYTKKTLSKDKLFQYGSATENAILFGNSILPGSLKSSSLLYGNNYCVVTDCDEDGNLYLCYSSDGTKLLDTPVGSLVYSTGVVKVMLSFYFTATRDYETAGILKFTAEPDSPDIDTYLNNIVIIDSVRAHISYA